MPASTTILVTGGAGFIGSNLVRALAARGDHVVAVDNGFLGRWENLAGVTFVQEQGDVADAAFVDRLFKKHKIQRVAHLAGYTSAPMYDADPRGRIQQNFQQFTNVLDAAREHGANVAYASTSSFYARCPKPFREDMAIVPATPYELSKFIMEQAAHTYWHQFGVVGNGLRFFSVYGPHEEHKTRYANNISQFYWSIVNDVRPVVFGDGTQTRDFTYVGDLVDAIIRILDKGKASEVYNIGTAREHSFNEMVDLINEALGKDVEPLYIRNPLKNYVQETLADTSKIQRDMGWKASTTLKEGIRLLAKGGTRMTRTDAEALYAWLPADVQRAAVGRAA